LEPELPTEGQNAYSGVCAATGADWSSTALPGGENRPEQVRTTLASWWGALMARPLSHRWQAAS